MVRLCEASKCVEERSKRSKVNRGDNGVSAGESDVDADSDDSGESNGNCDSYGDGDGQIFPASGDRQ